MSIESDSLNRAAAAADQRKSSLTRTRSYDEILIESDVKVNKISQHPATNLIIKKKLTFTG